MGFNLFGVNGAVQVDFVVLLFLFAHGRPLAKLTGCREHASLGHTFSQSQRTGW